MRHRRNLLILCFILGAILVTTAPMLVAGQDETGDPTEDRALQVVQQYLESRDPALLAEDAMYHDRTMQDPLIGRDEITWSQDEFYMDTFNETSVEPMRYFVSDNVVVAEFTFRGIHSGPYMGAPPTGENVEIMMVGIFEVHDDQIRTVDLYYDSATIHSQIGYGPEAGLASPVYTDPAMSPGVGVETMRRVIEDPVGHEGETVTVEGIIDERIGDHSFILREDGFLGDERILVVDGTEEGLDFISLDDALVRISGTVYRDYNAAVEMGSHIYTQDEDFTGFESYLVIVATSVQNLDDVETLGTLTDEPEAFYGQSVRIEGTVSEMISEQTFVLREDNFMGWLFGEDDILVLVGDSDMEFVPLSDTRVRVAGTVEAFNRAELEGRVGHPLDDERFNDREGEPVIIANSVINLEDVHTLSNVTDEPEAFYGQQVSIDGLVGDRVGTQGFELKEDVFLGSIFGEGRILVVYRDGVVFDAESWDGDNVRVTGTVHPFVRTDVENEVGYAFTDERFGDYEEHDGVIIADEIIPLD